MNPELRYIDIPRAGEGNSVHIGALRPLLAIFCQRIKIKAGIHDTSTITDSLIPCYIDGHLAALIFDDEEGIIHPVSNAYNDFNLVAKGSTR